MVIVAPARPRLRALRRPLGLGAALGLALAGACFEGDLLGERCVDDRECGPALLCSDGFCGGKREDCADPQVIQHANLLPNVVLVLDRSGSMDDPYLPGTDRWQVQAELVDAILEQAAGTMNVGAIFFPAPNAEDKYDGRGCRASASLDVPLCGDEGGACVGDSAAIRELLSAGGAIGNSPTVAALEVARAELDALHPELTRAIVLVTDDAPNCTDLPNPLPSDPDYVDLLDERIFASVTAASSGGVPVFVVGVGVSEALNPETSLDGKIDNIVPSAVLSELAIAGGQPRAGERAYYVPEEASELLAALAALPAASLDCRIPLGDPPAYANFLGVEVDGVAVDFLQAPRCDDSDGFRYTSTAYDAIELCGAACEAYRSSGAVTVHFDCPRVGG